MHLFDIENGVLETSGIVGGSTPHLAGTTLSSQLRGEDRVGVAYFGDGGSNQGVILETLNLAAIWDLPVIFLCENNQYAVTTSRDYAVAGDSIADRAAAMDITSKTIDGQDVLGVYETTKEAVEDARNGGGPQFIECQTYRFKGHHNREDALMSDQPYRSDEEVEDWRTNKDPIELYASRLREAGFTDDELTDVLADAVAVVDEAIEYMKQSEYPPAERADEHMYADQDYPNLPPNKYD
jgi:pyruvate dehydrogenase E1 component alpha subunit